MHIARRRFLQTLSCAGLLMTLPVAKAGSSVATTSFNSTSANLLAAWQVPGSGNYQVGVLQLNPAQPSLFKVEQAIDLPTRPHGLMHMQGDEYLVVARRPGDWMLRWNIRTGETSRIWQEEGYQLNGHSILNGNVVYTTETDLLSGQGAIAVREKNTLNVLDVWPSHGHDPHEMLMLPQGGLGIEEPFLLVANGGIQTHADMGRTKMNLNQMDSSVVALRPATGELLRKWVLEDAQLSLRHMAWHPDGVAGIAIQAQHDSESDRNAAPILAMLSAQGLNLVPASRGAKGYGGDIAATPEGFVISCTKNNSAHAFSLSGLLIHQETATAACALATEGGAVWLGHVLNSSPKSTLELDNHWLLLKAASA